MTDDRYPIGKFQGQQSYAAEAIEAAINKIESLPARLKEEVISLSPAQLDTPYREGGWTIRQVVHHLPDSHLNAYVRMKWALTEENPTIKTYDEKAWAETPDTKLAPEVSLLLLSALHAKWVLLMKTLTPDHLQREFVHPESKSRTPLNRMIALYAWHGEHHLAHVTVLKARRGWNK